MFVSVLDENSFWAKNPQVEQTRPKVVKTTTIECRKRPDHEGFVQTTKSEGLQLLRPRSSAPGSKAGVQELCLSSSASNRIVSISREQEIRAKKDLFQVTGEGFFQEDISKSLSNRPDLWMWAEQR